MLCKIIISKTFTVVICCFLSINNIDFSMLSYCTTHVYIIVFVPQTNYMQKWRQAACNFSTDIIIITSVSHQLSMWRLIEIFLTWTTIDSSNLLLLSINYIDFPMFNYCAIDVYIHRLSTTNILLHQLAN